MAISSCRCWISSQILCSIMLLPRPKLRKVDKANRLCLFHMSPLLMNRPPVHRHAKNRRLITGIHFWIEADKRMREFYTCGSWIKPVSDWTVGSIHKILSLCHYGLFHHPVPTQHHHLAATKADAEYIPIGVSQLETNTGTTAYMSVFASHFYIIIILNANAYFLKLRTYYVTFSSLTFKLTELGMSSENGSQSLAPSTYSLKRRGQSRKGSLVYFTCKMWQNVNKIHHLNAESCVCSLGWHV